MLSDPQEIRKKRKEKEEIEKRKREKKKGVWRNDKWVAIQSKMSGDPQRLNTSHKYTYECTHPCAYVHTYIRTYIRTNVNTRMSVLTYRWWGWPVSPIGCASVFCLTSSRWTLQSSISSPTKYKIRKIRNVIYKIQILLKSNYKAVHFGIWCHLGDFWWKLSVRRCARLRFSNTKNNRRNAVAQHLCNLINLKI